MSHFSKYGSQYKRDAAEHKLKYQLLDKDGNEVDFDYFANLVFD